MITILTLAEYKEKVALPPSSDETLQDKQLTNFIEDATNAVDDLCGGRVFKEYPLLDNSNSNDALRIYKLKRVLIDYVSVLDQTGKLWTTAAAVGGGSAPFSIRTFSTNGDMERRRQDMIKSLISGGWYTNVRTGDGVGTNALNTDSELEKLVAELGKYFLRTDGTNRYQDDLMSFPNTVNLNNTGDITGGSVVDKNTGIPRKPYLIDYDIKGFEPDKSKTSDKILDPLSYMYKYINEFDANYFNAFTKEQSIEIANGIFQASGIEYQTTFNYGKGYRVFVLDGTNSYFYVSMVDNNIGNVPISQTSNEFWTYTPNSDVPVGEIVEQLKPFIIEEVQKQIDNLPTIDVYDTTEIDDKVKTLNDKDTELETEDNRLRNAISSVSYDLIQTNKKVEEIEAAVNTKEYKFETITYESSPIGVVSISPRLCKDIVAVDLKGYDNDGLFYTQYTSTSIKIFTISGNTINITGTRTVDITFRKEV